MSCSGTIGKFAIVPMEAKPGIMNQALLRFRTTDKIFPEYLKMCLEYITLEFTRKSHGKGIQNVTSIDTLKVIKIPVPGDMEEQKRIVKSVSKYDDMIDKSLQDICDIEMQQTKLIDKYL